MTRLLALVVLLSVTASAEVRRFALVVGSNVGEGVRALPLKYADDDAVAMQELLLEAGVDSALLVSLDDDTARLHPLTAALGEPTLTRLTQVLDAQRVKMREARARGDEVEWLFFFSGHGDVDRGEGFLGLARGRLTRTHLHEQLLTRVEADRVHVIVDACRSAALVTGKGPGGRRLPLQYAFAAEPERPDRVGFLLSSSAARESHEWERFQAGVFSYEVRSGLRGAADADRDGRISYAELGAFLQTANQAIASPAHRPDFVVLPPRGAEGLSATVLSWPSPATLVDDVGLGRLSVERPSGERLLDLHVARGFPAQLFLPRERPLFVRTVDGATELELADGAPSRTSALPPSKDSTRARGALHRAFDLLFSAPFEPAAVERWARTWTPPDFGSLEQAFQPTLAERARPVLGWVAVAGTLLSAISFSVAWQRSGSGDALSQADRVNRNQEIAALNVAGVTSLAIAGAAATGWLVLSLRPRGELSVSLTASGEAGVLTVGGRW
ncbi:MAG: caspase family protein [Myxococcota bacterium]